MLLFLLIWTIVTVYLHVQTRRSLTILRLIRTRLLDKQTGTRRGITIPEVMLPDMLKHLTGVKCLEV